MIADIGIYENGSGGDLNLKNEDIEAISGLTNQAYLALFGGNKEQNTTENLDELEQRKDWWGNFYLKAESQFNSNFQRALRTIALNSGGLIKLEDAAKEDLKYLQEYANVTVTSRIIGVDKYELSVFLEEPENKQSKVKFVWDGQKEEVIIENEI